MNDVWGWWKTAVRAKAEGGAFPAINETTPQAGFYFRKASRQGGRIPVCIYRDSDGDIVARQGCKAEHRVVPAGEVWTWVAENVVTREAYVHAWEKAVWEDGSPTVAPGLPAGSNLPVDPFERLKAEVDDKLESAAVWIKAHPKVESKVDCDYAANLNRELLALHKQADKLHEAEKAPHLEKCREIDAKFKFRPTVKATADSLKRLFEAFMVAEDRRLRAEAELRHQEELARVAAARARIEAEQVKLRENDPIAFFTSPQPEAPVAPEKPVVKVQAGGGVGSARGLKTVWEPEISDYAAALAYYANHAKVREAVESLIKAEVKIHKGETKVPGVKVIERRVAA